MSRSAFPFAGLERRLLWCRRPEWRAVEPRTEMRMPAIEWVLVAIAEDGTPQDVLISESHCDAAHLADDLRRAGTTVTVEERDATSLRA